MLTIEKPTATRAAELPDTRQQPKLLDRMREAIRVRHYSLATERNYIQWTRRFIYFHGKRHPANMGAAEVEAFLSALALPHKADLLLLFDLALETAMRLRECYTLEVAQIDLPGRTIYLDKTKNGDNRQVPLSSIALSRLESHIKHKKNGLLLPWWNGQADPLTLRRTTSLLSRQFARIFAAAKVADFHFHDLRHEATSRLFERTALSEFEIAKITGHRSPRMLMRYANLRASSLAQKLW